MSKTADRCLLNVADLALAARLRAEQCGIPSDSPVLANLARKIRTAAEDGRLRYVRINNRYYFEPDYAPVAADILGLRTPAF